MLRELTTGKRGASSAFLMETIYHIEFPDMLIEARAVRDADFAVFKACARDAVETPPSELSLC